MARATIKVEFDPGTDICDAFAEAVRIASLINAFVDFTFNGAVCTAHPYGSVSRGVYEYHECVKKDSDFKFAHAR